MTVFKQTLSLESEYFLANIFVFSSKYVYYNIFKIYNIL